MVAKIMFAKLQLHKPQDPWNNVPGTDIQTWRCLTIMHTTIFSENQTQRMSINAYRAWWWEGNDLVVL